MCEAIITHKDLLSHENLGHFHFYVNTSNIFYVISKYSYSIFVSICLTHLSLYTVYYKLSYYKNAFGDHENIWKYDIMHLSCAIFNRGANNFT